MSVHLHIDRLVVEGLDLAAADAPRLAAAIEAELAARLTTRNGAEWSDLAVPALPPLDIGPAPGSGPNALGRGVAAALHGALKP
ncbi:MAG: hypothetical protein ACJ8EB_10440 [Allosphingosinicella sp.]